MRVALGVHACCKAGVGEENLVSRRITRVGVQARTAPCKQEEHRRDGHRVSDCVCMHARIAGLRANAPGIGGLKAREHLERDVLLVLA